MNKFLSAAYLLVLLTACTPVKVMDAWKRDNVNTIKDQNILVIARTSNKLARIAFEEEIADQIRSGGMNAAESYNKMPELKPDEKLSKEQVEMVKKLLQDQGYNGVVVSVIKDVQETTRVMEEGGYYAGESYRAYYPIYYGDFYGYYAHPRSYSDYGTYVPSTISTYTSKTYILETTAYNLDQPEEKQLVAVVTSKIENPQNVATTAKQYAKAIAKGLR